MASVILFLYRSFRTNECRIGCSELFGFIQKMMMWPWMLNQTQSIKISILPY